MVRKVTRKSDAVNIPSKLVASRFAAAHLDRLERSPLLTILLFAGPLKTTLTQLIFIASITPSPKEL